MKQFIIFVVFTFLSFTALAQKPLPIIKANSKLVDIKEGNQMHKGAWIISPDLKPDVYWTSLKGSSVTFYTDQDSISFRIEMNAYYNFIILLNDKDSAFTQIRFIDLIPIKIPTRFIYKWDSTHIDALNNTHFDTLKDPLSSKVFLRSLQPILIKHKVTSDGYKSDTLWSGEKQYNITDEVKLNIPIRLINSSKDFQLVFELEYAQNIKLHSGGLAGWKTETIDFKNLTPPDLPFKFVIESTPIGAELFYLDEQSWDFHESQLKSIFKNLEKTYDLNSFSKANKDLVSLVLVNYSNPTGYSTPTDIWIYDTPYILFVKFENKIRCTKINPNRGVPEMNRKKVSL